jgi:ferredoxin
MDCVEVCPVDCFYEGENFLVINPDECIDCGVCVPECPVGAIVSENNVDTDINKWLEINQKYSLLWPVITKKRPGDVPQDAAAWDGVPNKYEEHFSEAPGKGN